MHIQLKDLDFHPLGREIKQRRLETGLSQRELGLLVDRTQRSIMNFENKGQMPTLDVFYKIVTFLGISVDKFFYPESSIYKDDNRVLLNRLLNEMTEREIAILIGTAKSIICNRE